MWATKQDQNLPMATEKLKFKLELFSTFWDEKPKLEILINEESKILKDIDTTEQSPSIVEFEHECIEGEQYQLTLKRTGKDKNQTVIDSDGKITKDQLLHIKSIEIDEIDIGALVYEGVYTPDYPEPWYSQQVEMGKTPPNSFKNVTAMGHNGTWQLKFQSPFYMWLLENLY